MSEMYLGNNKYPIQAMPTSYVIITGTSLPMHYISLEPNYSSCGSAELIMLEYGILK
jgi:hypothetical protein